jgi:hypothetical protein
MRKTSIFGLSVLAFAVSSWVTVANAQAPTPPDATPAPAADAPAPDAKPMKHMKMKHHMMHEKTYRSAKTGKLTGSKEGDAMVEDLNDKSLAAAKAGTSFTPGK